MKRKVEGDVSFTIFEFPNLEHNKKYRILEENLNKLLYVNEIGEKK